MNFLKKNLLYLVITAACFALLVFPKLREGIRERLFPIAAVENAVKISDQDYNLELKGINTPNIHLQNLKGKTIFLNFWGTWCPPCRAEWPSIQKLYNQKNGKISFVLIAMQDQEETVRKFLKDNNYTVPVYIATSPVSEKLLPQSFPTTFLLGKDGRILMKEESARDWSATKTLEFIDNVTK